MYANGTQLQSMNPDGLGDFKSKVEACVSGIISWMSVNHRKINSDKTEFLICYSRFSKLSQAYINSIQVGNDIILPS